MSGDGSSGRPSAPQEGDRDRWAAHVSRVSLAAVSWGISIAFVQAMGSGSYADVFRSNGAPLPGWIAGPRAVLSEPLGFPDLVLGEVVLLFAAILIPLVVTGFALTPLLALLDIHKRHERTSWDWNPWFQGACILCILLLFGLGGYFRSDLPGSDLGLALVLLLGLALVIGTVTTYFMLWFSASETFRSLVLLTPMFFIASVIVFGVYRDAQKQARITDALFCLASDIRGDGAERNRLPDCTTLRAADLLRLAR